MAKQSETANNLLNFYFKQFAAKHSDPDFFHPCNRDLWLKEFADFLRTQIDPDFPSND